MFLARLWQAMPSAVSLGFLWGVMTLGVYPVSYTHLYLSN